MFTKLVQFEDLEGNTVQDTFYFNFNKLEVIEMMELDRLEEKMQRLSKTAEEKGVDDPENSREAYETFKDLILKAYGHKAPNGRDFHKKDPDTGRPYRNDLEASPALSEIIIEFMQNPDLGAQFVEKCLPPKMVAEVKAQQKTPEEITELVTEADRRQQDPETRIEPGTLPAGVEPPQEKRQEDLTADDIRGMDDEAFAKLDPKRLNQDAMYAAFTRKSSK